MVNNRKILSHFQESPPINDQANRKIAGGPLYALTEVLALLKSGGKAIIPWTKKCGADLKKLAFDQDDVQELFVECFSNGGYKFEGSEWCENCPNGPIAACDAYEISRSEWNKHAKKYYQIKYYIKFAIGANGKILLLVSCHL